MSGDLELQIERLMPIPFKDLPPYEWLSPSTLITRRVMTPSHLLTEFDISVNTCGRGGASEPQS